MASNIIVSGSTDRTLKVWNAESGTCVHTLYGHTSTVRCMHLHDSKVVSGSRDATLRMWDVDTGECLHVLVGHVAAVRCVQYDGRLVVSGAYDYMVKVWNPEREECLHTLSGHTNRVYSLQVCTVVSQSTVWVQSCTHSSYPYQVRLLSTITPRISSLTGSTSCPAVWTPASGCGMWRLAPANTLSWATSPSPQVTRPSYLHTGLRLIVDVAGMELKDNILVSGNADSTVKIWDILSGQCLQTLSGPNKHQSAVTCLQFNNKFVITSSDDGTVKLWDVKTGE